jgi:hypothetical protein
MRLRPNAHDRTAVGKVAALAVVAFLLTSPSVGGQESTAGAYVDVGVKPAVVLPGQPVTISGSTGSYEKKNQASVVIRHDSGTPNVTLTAAVAPDGRFTVTFKDTKKPGLYKVSVTAPDGKGKGATQFRVDSTSDLVDEVDKVSQDLDARLDKLVAYLKTAAASLPASAERDELIKKVQNYGSTINTVDLPPVEILGELRRVVQGPTVVYLPDQQILGELRDWIPQGEEAIDKIDRSKIGEKPAPICETIHTALEGAKFAAYAFAIETSLWKTLLKIGVDKGVPAAVQGVVGENVGGLAASSGLKLAIEKAKKHGEALEAVNAIGLDLTEFLVSQVFELYCSAFEGPVSVKMTMVWKEGALPWLKYGVTLDGQFRLRYPKEAPAGQPVYMTGEFEGNATNFTFWEDVTVVEPLPKGLLVIERRWLAPIPFVNSTKSPVDFGMVARAVTPAYFNVPVIGEMTGETIKVQFKEARVDFADIVKNRLLFVVYGGLIPDFKVFTFPIQKAQWILAKGMEDPCILKVAKESSGERMIEFDAKTHKDSPDKSVNVDWLIKLSARAEAREGGRPGNPAGSRQQGEARAGSLPNLRWE